MKYLMLSEYDVAFCEDIVQLSQAMYGRSSMYCRVLASEDWGELLTYAKMGQQRLYDNCIDGSGKGKLPLPVVVTEQVALTTDKKRANLANTIEKSELGAWGVSSLNGFCVVDSVADFCYLLAGGDMVYPIGQWYPSHEEAVIAARNNYTQRFYNRFMVMGEQTRLPQTQLDYFKDPYFAEREKRREIQIKAYRSWWLSMWNRGWF